MSDIITNFEMKERKKKVRFGVLINTCKHAKWNEKSKPVRYYYFSWFFRLRGKKNGKPWLRHRAIYKKKGI